MDRVHTTLSAFPIACFTLTLMSDIAYLLTVNLLWLHFSEWLLLAGLVFGGLAFLARLVDMLVWRAPGTWPPFLGGIVVLLLATLNSLVHTADGWTAVVPYGLTVSILTILAMGLTGWFAQSGHRYA